MVRSSCGRLAGCLAVALGVLAIVAGAIGEQRDGALRPATAAAGERTLDGPWVVRGDRAGRGMALGWASGGFSGRTISVPFSPNARHVLGAAGTRSFEGSVAWYRTTIDVARDGDYAIRFDSVNHRATVWIDGRRVTHHVGTYLPFEARTRLTAGAHLLVVRADWRNPAAMKADAWHRTWFNFGGINRPVTIRPLGLSELDSPSIVTRLDGTAAVVDVTVRVTNRTRPRALLVHGSLAGATLHFDPVHLARGAEAVVRARARIDDPDLWEPGHPALQTLRLAVAGESAL